MTASDRRHAEERESVRKAEQGVDFRPEVHRARRKGVQRNHEQLDEVDVPRRTLASDRMHRHSQLCGECSHPEQPLAWYSTIRARQDEETKRTGGCEEKPIPTETRAPRRVGGLLLFENDRGDVCQDRRDPDGSAEEWP